MVIFLFLFSITHSLPLPTHCTVLAKTCLLAVNFKTTFLRKSACVQHTRTLGAPQSTWFAWCLGNRFTKRCKHKKKSNPKLWHIEISHSTYSFHLSRPTYIINMASYHSCLLFLHLRMHSSLFLQHELYTLECFTKHFRSKDQVSFLERDAVFWREFLSYTFLATRTLETLGKDCEHACPRLPLELSLTKSEFFLQSVFPTHMRVRLLGKCYFTANDLQSVLRSQGLGNTWPSEECILSILKHLTSKHQWSILFSDLVLRLRNFGWSKTVTSHNSNKNRKTSLWMS